MVVVAEALRAISYTILIISPFIYYSYLAKTKKQRKLSTFEFLIYIVIGIGMVLSALSMLLFTFAH